MAERARGDGWAALAGVAGIALFWTGVFVGGALVPGYTQRANYISSLASRGSPVAAIGIAAITSMGAAFGAGAWLAWRAWGRRSVAAALALAGGAHLVIAAFRIRCPLGPAGCRFIDQPVVYDASDRLHGYGVEAFEVCLLAAMLLLAQGALRARSSTAWPRWLGAVSVPLGVASVVLLAKSTGTVDTGLWQRLWAVVNSTWLVLVVWTAWRRLRRGELA